MNAHGSTPWLTRSGHASAALAFVAVAVLGAAMGGPPVERQKRAVAYTRLYADQQGESHFADTVMPLEMVEFAPPAQPILASEFSAAQAYGFIRAAPGWVGEWHPTPTRQFLFYLSGDSELEVSDGEVRHFRAGDILLVEDTLGIGHVSRVVGNEDALAAVVQARE
jgi:quercetin dioxygenase-like cupin family protein